MAKFKITKENSDTIYYIVYGLSILGVVIFSLLSMHEAIISTSPLTSKIYLFLVFVFLLISTSHEKEESISAFPSAQLY